MDQLDLLKKDWKKQEGNLPKISAEDISKLIHKKSSSIVKWIFIISVLEFVVPYLILYLTDYDESTMKGYKELGLTNFMTIFYIFYYTVILYFIFRFYKNYKTISANSNAKILMQNIIRTRRVVKYYIWFNLSLIPILFGVIFYKLFQSPQLIEQLPANTSIVMIWIVAFFLVAVFVLLFWLFYQLIYGVLLKKLKKNYSELMSNGDV
jgi:hypothetical protein